MSDLPYAADAELSVSREEFDIIEKEYLKQREAGHETLQVKFNYAWVLIKSPKYDDQMHGVRLLHEIYKASGERRRECLYYLSLGHYKMGKYEEAKQLNDKLLEKEPNNLQARSLGELIDQKLTREGYIGLAIAGTAAALGTVLLATFIRRAHRD